MLGQPLVAVRDEGRPTPTAFVDAGSALDNLSLDPTGGEDEVERLLVPRTLPEDALPVRPSGHVGATAGRAHPGVDLHLLADPDTAVHPPAGLLRFPLSALA